MTYPDPASSRQPIPVHVTSVAAEVALGTPPPPAPRRRVITEYTTVVASLANPVQPVLPASERRLRAQVSVSGPIGAGASATSYGWLAATEAAAAKASVQSDGSIGAYISAGATIHTPLTIDGTNALWVALDSGATTNMILTVTADYEAERP